MSQSESEVRNPYLTVALFSNHRAEKIEAQVWETVSGILTDPERLRADLEEMLDRERQSSLRGDPELETKAWMD